jgi:Asp-tRNA(Asn)/Glu-tRNA(Gln) amidotransferase A subunit family amidase
MASSRMRPALPAPGGHTFGTVETQFLDSVVAAAEAIAEGRLSASELVGASLRRYRELESTVHAFAWLDEERAERLGRERDDEAAHNEPPRGPLHGVPIGIKDIFDTAGIPTECGSELFVGRVPRRSATVVRRLEGAGAIALGKTVTAELAYYTPGLTRNPHDPSRTPGGSSQGSAAAVAGGVIPAAVGSQTNGSTIRPAAFCGLVGFKPTAGRIPTTGAMTFSRTLDQVGVFTRDVRDARFLAAVMAGTPMSQWTGNRPARPRLAVVRTSDWFMAQDAAKEGFEAAALALADAGAEVDDDPPPLALDESADVVATPMAYEGARSIGRIALRNPELVSPRALTLYETGRVLTRAAHEAALANRVRLIGEYERWSRRYDAVLTLPAAGEAPDASTTGDPRFCSRWTLVGAPAISIPTGFGPRGLPLGLQIVGRIGMDAEVLEIAEWAEKALGH